MSEPGTRYISLPLDVRNNFIFQIYRNQIIKFLSRIIASKNKQIFSVKNQRVVHPGFYLISR